MDLVLTIPLISPVCHHNLVMCHRDYEGNLDTKVQSDCLLPDWQLAALLSSSVS